MTSPDLPMKDGFHRVGSLIAAPGFLARHGLDPDAVAVEAGLDPAALRDPNAIIPYVAFGRYAAACAARTGRPDFGLVIGQEGTTAMLGLIGGLMRNAPTLSAALSDLVTNQPRYARGSAVFALRFGDAAYWGYVCYQRGAPGRDQIHLGAMAHCARVLEELCGIRPRGVILSERAPDASGFQRLCERHFGVPVTFDSIISALVLDPRDLDLPVRGADPAERARLEALLAQYRPIGDPPPFAERVLHALVSRLTWEPCPAERIARLLGLSPRTMERRLHEAGTSFTAQRDRARCEVAQHLLRETRLEAGQVGAAVGYAEQAVFTRAFRRWTGMTPGAWRQAQAGGGAGG
jgi:AraC-like DNA-binding protein